MRRLVLLANFFFVPCVWAANTLEVNPITKRLDLVTDTSSAGHVTGLSIAATDLDCTVFTNGGALTTDSGGNFVCSNDDTGGSSAPADATYLTLSTNATLTDERVFTDGLAIDSTDAGAGSTLTVALDPTELTGSRTWGDASTDTLVWTWDRTTGTDPTLTFGSGTVTGQTVAASSAFELGSDRISDFTGSGLSVVGGALTATGDITAVGNCSTGACFTGATGTTLSSNTDLIMDLDDDNTGAESFQIRTGTDTIIGQFYETGEMDWGIIGADSTNGVVNLYETAAADATIYITGSGPDSAGVYVRNSNGTLSVPTSGAVNDKTFFLEADTYNASAGSYDRIGSLHFVVDGTVASGGDITDSPGRIEFYTTPDGSSTELERMQVNNAGHVTVGSSGVDLGVLAVDGFEDAVQFLVQGNATQTNLLGVFENSAGADQVVIGNTGTVTGVVVSTTSALQVGSDYITDITGSGLSIVGGALTSSGGSGNSFETIAVPAGTNPVADSSTDTLTITETSFLTITGTAGTDTIDITQVTTDLGTDGLIAANAVALGNDTTNAYVADLTAGTAIDVSGGGGETATVTVDWDSTEVEATTWGAGGNATNTWTYNLSGTDPTLIFGSNTVTGPIVAASVAVQLAGDHVTDFTGTDLSTSGGALTVDTLPNLTGTLDVDSGGTGAATLTSNGVLYGNTTGAVQVTAQGGTNTVLTASAGAPAFSTSPTVTNLTATNTVTGATVEATSVLEIPNGASPTVAETGAIAYDTTTGQLVVYSGSSVNVFEVDDPKCTTIENLVAADDNMLLWDSKRASTISAVRCVTSGFTTQPTLSFEDGSGNAMTGAPECAAPLGAAWVNITAGGGLTPGESLRFDTTNTTAPTTGTQCMICFTYTHDRQ